MKLRIASLLVLCAAGINAQSPNPLLTSPANRQAVVPLPIARSHAPMILHEKHGKNATSTNWSGYAVTGPDGSVNDVKGSWIVPTLNCANSPNPSYSAFWAGIDGYDSNTVEQTGTESDCQNGHQTNYAWFEFYPHPSYEIGNFAVNPGNVIFAEVSYSRGGFDATIKNVSTGQSYSVSTKMNNAKRASAEWVVEAPWSGGVLPLPDFVSASFGQDQAYAGVGTCDATLGSAPASPIGSFATSVSIQMVTSSGAPKTTLPTLSTDLTSFSEGWVSPGP